MRPDLPLLQRGITLAPTLFPVCRSVFTVGRRRLRPARGSVPASPTSSSTSNAPAVAPPGRSSLPSYKARAAIAFPDGRRHRSLVEPVRIALERLEITVFWIREDGTVSVEPAD